jgi:hypothetical protein
MNPIGADLAQVGDHLVADTGDAIARLADELRLCEGLIDRLPEQAAERAEAAYAALVRAGRAKAVGTDLRNRVFLYRCRTRLAPGLQAHAAGKPREEPLRAAQEAFRQAQAKRTAERVAWLREALDTNASPLGRLVDRGQ